MPRKRKQPEWSGQAHVGVEVWYDSHEVRAVFEAEAAAKAWEKRPATNRGWSRLVETVPFVAKGKRAPS